MSEREQIIGRCAVPGCNTEAKVRVTDRQGRHDIYCVMHAREELETAARFGTDDMKAAAQKLLDESEPSQ